MGTAGGKRNPTPSQVRPHELLTYKRKLPNLALRVIFECNAMHTLFAILVLSSLDLDLVASQEPIVIIKSEKICKSILLYKIS